MTNAPPAPPNPDAPRAESPPQRGTSRIVWIVVVLLLGGAAVAVTQLGGGGSTGARRLFVDIAREAGVDFVHVNGAYGKKYFPEVMGGGCAFLDYDGDGDQDILFVNGTYWQPEHRPPGAPRPTSALYRNDGAGTFEDVTREAGMDVDFFGLGVAVADVEGDGDPDVLLTGINGNRFLRNEGGRFVDATESSGLRGYRHDYNTSAGFFDGDGDGDLDLFICNYVLWTRKIDQRINYRLEELGRAYGPPTVWEGRLCYYYRNRGDGTFEDRSRQSGVQVVDGLGAPRGKALGVTFFDLERDGDLDIFVANDTVHNFLFVNRGDGTFDERGEEGGVALDPRGEQTGAMGVDVADLAGDGRLALAVGNFAAEVSSLYMRRRNGAGFTDQGEAHGLRDPTYMAITFGLFFFDYDLDGHLDLFQANGGLEPGGEVLNPPTPEFQSAQLLRNVPTEGHRVFELVPDGQAGDLRKPVIGRGAAYADIDGDGDLDVLVAQIAGRPLLLRNDQKTGHHWLRIRLQNTGKNRDAIGAWIELEAGGRLLRRQVMPVRSYLSSVELPVTFGLGPNQRVDALRVIWPDGVKQEVAVENVDQALVVNRKQ